MELPSEPNTLAASVIFLGSIVIDAITANDPLVENNAPTALRSSAVVLIAILSAPPIRQWMLIEQRLAVGVPLAAVALVGWHEQSVGARICDALFVVVTIGTALMSYWGEGQKMTMAKDRLQKAVSKDAPPFLRREALINLAIAQLLYSSFRILRIALRHPTAVRDYSVATYTFNGAMRDEPGYAFASTASTGALAFGAAAGIGIASVLLLNKDVREHGTSAATLVLTTGAFAQFVGAFLATMAASEQLDNLTGIYSAGACGVESICKPAFLARRFGLVNTCPAALWLNGFGTLLLAFAPSIRMKSRSEMEAQTRNFEVTVYAFLSTIVCLWSLFVYLSFTGAEAITDYAAVSATLAVAITAFLDPLVGSTIFVIAVGADMIMLWSTYGGVHIFAHFTHCTNAVLLVLLALYVLTTTVVDFTWRWLPARVIEISDRVTGVLAIAGTSLGVLLFLSSCAMQASYDGVLIPDDQFRASDRRYARTAAAFIMEHWLPVLVWLPLYSCRCEVEMLSYKVRAAIWYLAAAIPVAIWILVVAAQPGSLPVWANGWYGSAGFVMSIGVAGVVPWSVVVWA